MARILRGDIVWADLNPVRGREQAGMRPVLILSEDVFNENSGASAVFGKSFFAIVSSTDPKQSG